MHRILVQAALLPKCNWWHNVILIKLVYDQNTVQISYAPSGTVIKRSHHYYSQRHLNYFYVVMAPDWRVSKSNFQYKITFQPLLHKDASFASSLRNGRVEILKHEQNDWYYLHGNILRWCTTQFSWYSLPVDDSVRATHVTKPNWIALVIFFYIIFLYFSLFILYRLMKKPSFKLSACTPILRWLYNNKT